MPRLKITLAYDGTPYAGWQTQAHKDHPHPPTIQAEMEKALAFITATKRIIVVGAGRTDSGVHAEAQVCHADVPERSTPIDWVRALNANLPDAVRVLHTEEVDDSFHACNSATKRTYSYSLWSDTTPALPRLRTQVWSTPPLDMAMMMAAAHMLEGKHDFASFQNAGTPCKDTVRTIYSIRLELGRVGSLICPPRWPVHAWTIEGSGFLRQMVRNIIGLLVWVGRGKVPLSTIPTILAAHNRTFLPSPSAPAKGLTLMQVEYPK